MTPRRDLGARDTRQSTRPASLRRSHEIASSSFQMVALSVQTQSSSHAAVTHLRTALQLNRCGQ